jgi:ketosteroid isomerase-like protein
MRKTALLLCSIGLAGCPAPPAPPALPAPSSDWNAQDSASLKPEIEGMLKSIDAGDFQAMIAKMDADATVFDFDADNKPIKMGSKAEVEKTFAGMAEMVKSQGLKFGSTIVSNDCHANAMMGFCAVEFDQTITAGGNTMGPFKFRGTLVARKLGGQWRWAHWHGSFREMPAMPPPG